MSSEVDTKDLAPKWKGVPGLISLYDHRTEKEDGDSRLTRERAIGPMEAVDCDKGRPGIVSIVAQ